MKKSAYSFLITNKHNNTLLEHIYELIQNNKPLKIDEISENSYMSKSSITRFFNQHGFEGFKEFKYLLLNESTNDIKYNVSTQLEQEIMFSPIETTSRLNNEAVYERAFELLEKASVNYVLGIGGNNSVSIEMKTRLERFGFRVEHNLDTHAFWVSLFNAKPGDNLWVFSYTGETSEIINLVNLAKSKNVNIISITRDDVTTLSTLSDVIFKIDNSENLIRILSLKSRVAMLSIIIKFTLYIYMKDEEFYNKLLLTNIYHH